MNTSDQQGKPNILLIVMDATRARHLSCYGYERETTPHIDQIANQGVVYERSISAGTWTLASMASIFTGMHVSQHGTTFHHQYLEPQFTTLAEVLQRNGYQTALFSAMGWVSKTFGFHRGFDTVRNYVTDTDDSPLKRNRFVEKLTRYGRLVLFGGSRGKLTYELARDLERWLDTTWQPERPFFAVAHFGDPHWPWVYHPNHSWVNGMRRPPRFFAPDGHKFVAGELALSDEQRKLMVDFYDGEISFLDQYIGQIIIQLGRMGHLDNTLVIVTSDHGEHLTDHGLMGHSMSMYESILHVPLILYHPEYFSGGKRVSQLVQTIDIFPTILELLGRAGGYVPRHQFRYNLLPEQVEASPREFTITEYLAPNLKRFQRVCPDFDTTPFDRKLRALRTPTHKLIWSSNGQHELYDLVTDPDELHNLAESEPERLASMQGQLQAWLDGLDAAQFEELDPEMEQIVSDRLRDLGYF